MKLLHLNQSLSEVSQLQIVLEQSYLQLNQITPDAVFYISSLLLEQSWVVQLVYIIIGV